MDNIATDWIGKTILIVEDDDANFHLIQEILEPTKTNLIRDKNGMRVIETIEKFPSIDLVLMDIRLPVGSDGLKLTQQIKKIRHDLPVIAQTALAMKNDREKCLAAGCSDYISKPYSEAGLIEIIKKYISSVSTDQFAETSI